MTTLGEMILSLTTFSITTLSLTRKIQHAAKWHRMLILSVFMLGVVYTGCPNQAPGAECGYTECHFAECRYAECHYAECCYAECHYAECRYAERRYAKCRFSECHSSFKIKKSRHFIFRFQRQNFYKTSSLCRAKLACLALPDIPSMVQPAGVGPGAYPRCNSPEGLPSCRFCHSYLWKIVNIKKCEKNTLAYYKKYHFMIHKVLLHRSLGKAINFKWQESKPTLHRLP